MKLSEQIREFLAYVFLVLVLAFMLLGCNSPKFAKRRPTPDEIQMKFFKEQINIKQYYHAKR